MIKHIGYCMAYITNAEGDEDFIPLMSCCGSAKHDLIRDWDSSAHKFNEKPHKLTRKHKCGRTKVFKVFANPTSEEGERESL